MPAQLRTRKPTGRPPWPLILLEGPEKVGKTYEALRFSGDERITVTWALDLGEGSLDEYGAIPGSDFDVLIHDGTWRQIIEQLEAVVDAADEVAEAGGVPMLVIDSGTCEWDMLKAWVDVRARRQPSNRRKLAEDPDAEVKASRNLWNDADSRHNRFMNLVRRFRGPVIITARGKWVSATGKDGQPIPNEKEYRVEGQKNLGYAANAWVRLSREEGPTVVGLRHVQWGVRPGIDRPQAIPDFTLGWLIFDLIGCAAGTTTARDQAELNADQVMPDEEVTAPDDDAPAAPPAATHIRSVRPEAIGPDAAAQEQRSTAQKAATGVDALLAAEDAIHARHLSKIAWESAAKNFDVSGLLAPLGPIRMDLDLPDGQRITLSQFGQLVSKFWELHDRAPGTPPTTEAAAPAPVEEEPVSDAEQAAMDVLADELGARPVDEEGAA